MTPRKHVQFGLATLFWLMGSVATTLGAIGALPHLDGQMLLVWGYFFMACCSALAAFLWLTLADGRRPRQSQWLTVPLHLALACTMAPYDSKSLSSIIPRSTAMSAFRFSLLGLAGFVTLFAVGCGALIDASPLVAGIAWSAIFLILALATIAGMVRSPPDRSWWIGFATLGWLYVLTVVGPFAELSDWMHFNKLLETAAAQMPKALSDARFVTTTPTSRFQYTIRPFQVPNAEYVTAFIRTSHALLTLLLACLGGYAGRWIYERN